jgi:hypothetical protein
METNTSLQAAQDAATKEWWYEKKDDICHHVVVLVKLQFFVPLVGKEMSHFYPKNWRHYIFQKPWY